MLGARTEIRRRSLITAGHNETRSSLLLIRCLWVKSRTSIVFTHSVRFLYLIVVRKKYNLCSRCLCLSTHSCNKTYDIGTIRSYVKVVLRINPKKYCLNQNSIISFNTDGISNILMLSKFTVNNLNTKEIYKRKLECNVSCTEVEANEDGSCEIATKKDSHKHLWQNQLIGCFQL